MKWGLAEKGVGRFLFLVITVHYELHSVYCLLELRKSRIY